jgi:formate hydrogenlyase subunit 3/multisubunit Na+/H+ antiporter MnhD subunit
LAAFFLAVVNLGGAAASLFAIGYGQHEHAPRRVLPFYPVYLAGMNLVVLADDAFTFLVSWEFMSLSSWALVMAHHRVRDNVRAGYIYLVMASFGTIMLLLAFGLLAGPDGGYTFAEMREAHPSAGLAALVLCLALLGAGSKAGLVPLHVWLPLAHPAVAESAALAGVDGAALPAARRRAEHRALRHPRLLRSPPLSALARVPVASSPPTGSNAVPPQPRRLRKERRPR